MSTTAVATPYAMALLDLAVAQNVVPTVREQIDALAKLARESEAFRVVLSNPTVSVDERKAVLTALIDKLGLNALMRNFLLVLADKDRLAALGEIARIYGRLADDRTGAARAEVVSSAELSAAQKQALTEALSRLTGKTVTFELQVDPSLVGGIQVSVDGKVYDTSVATRFKRLREAILAS